MPRYRVILEFDHPGQGVPVEEHSTTNSPEKWNWSMKLTPECTNITALFEELHRSGVWVGMGKGIWGFGKS